MKISNINNLINNQLYSPSIVYNMDCIEGMKQYDNNYFDLAVVDPPYGLGEDGESNHSRSRLANAKNYAPKGWDKLPPSVDYFVELKRISKNQIIFGANHFIELIPKANSSSWLVWDKENGENDFADCELAYTSFKSAVRKFKFRWAGMLQGNMKQKEIRIHPTQKPVALYDWIFKKYATKGMKILDTHLGSGSSRISANKAELDFTAFELDEDYFNDSESRFKNFICQTRLELV